MTSKRQLGYATAEILQAIVRGHLYGFDIMEHTSLPSGTVFPTLARVEKRGLVRARWENEKVARGEGRPRRRYYELTAQGETALSEAITRMQAFGAFPGADPASGRGGK